jgi:hypothetical protein
MKRSDKPQPITLTVAQQEKLRDQFLLILADYKGCSLEYLQSEGFRIDVTHRLMMNVHAVARMRV